MTRVTSAVTSCGQAPRQERPGEPGLGVSRFQREPEGDDLAQLEQYLRVRWNVPPVNAGEPVLLHRDSWIVAAYLQTVRSSQADQDVSAAPPDPAHSVSESLRAIQQGDIPMAEAHARRLLERLVIKDGAGFWYFQSSCSPAPSLPPDEPWCSAVSQGFGLVALAALHKSTGKEEYCRAAAAVFRSFFVSAPDGGVVRTDGGMWWPQEFPSEDANSTLRGAALALLALHDYWILVSEPKAKELFDRGVSTLEELAPRYETVAAGFPEVVCASPGGRRSTDELLTRVLAGSDCFVAGARMLVDGNMVSEVPVGSAGDDDGSAEAYVWIDPEYQMWGEREQRAGRGCRNAFGRPKAESGHAPLSFQAPGATAPQTRHVIELEYSIPGSQAGKLQAYDGSQWWAIAELTPTAGEWRTASAALPSGLVNEVFGGTQRRVDIRFADDNAVLLLALSDLSGSERLRLCGLRWLSGTARVPYIWRNVPRQTILRNPSDKPVLTVIPGSIESGHVEYPCVVELRKGHLMMWYTAFGTDSRWRICLATSDDDGGAWKRHGAVFGDDNRPPWMAGDIAFPFVFYEANPTDAARRYRMYFSAKSASETNYSALGLSYSADGQHWTRPNLVMQGMILDPSVARDATGVYHLYYTSLRSPYKDIPISALCAAASLDGESWSPPEVIRYGARLTGDEGIYTSEAFHLGPYICLLYTSAFGRESHGENLMFSKDGRSFYDVLGNPLAISPLGRQPVWNSLRYGWTILAETSRQDDRWRVYYSGISGFGQMEGQIGMAEIDPEDLLAAIDETLKLLGPPQMTPSCAPAEQPPAALSPDREQLCDLTRAAQP